MAMYHRNGIIIINRARLEQNHRAEKDAIMQGAQDKDLNIGERIDLSIDSRCLLSCNRKRKTVLGR